MLRTLNFIFFVFLFTAGFSQIDSTHFRVFYYENSNIKSSEGFIVDGQPEGYWKTYYPNGNLKSEGNRKNHLLDSVWKFYSKDGFVTNEITYKENKKHGTYKVYADSGVLKQEFTFKNDVKDGPFYEYYPSGQIKKAGEYKDDIIEGTVKTFAEDDGRTITITKFTQGYIEDEEYINRKDSNGNKQGVWKEFYDDGKLKKEAHYKDGKVDGIVKEFNKRGELKTLEKFKDGIEEVEAKEVEFVKLYREYYPDGSVKLEGGQVDGKKNGFFRKYNEKGEFIQTLIYEKGDKVAEGYIDSNLMYQGKWIFFYKSGKLKGKGEYIDDKKVGEWIFYYENGNLEQKGTYKAGKPVGEWNWYHENKQLKRKEFYVNGYIDGEIVEYDTIGNIIMKGNYAAGFKEGTWFLEVGDHKEEGEFLDDGKHGVWTHTYDNGQVAFKGEYISGMPVGKHKYYHENGQLRLEGKYENGLKEGDWRRYDADGNELIKITYENGIEVKIDGQKYQSPKLEY